MKHVPLLLALLLLFIFPRTGAARSWAFREFLPADIQELQKGNWRSKIRDQTLNYLVKFEELPEQTALALLFVLISDTETDLAVFFQEYRGRLIARPAMGLEVALMLLHTDSSGQMQDGRFVRGNSFDPAQTAAHSYHRNRWHALKLVLAVRDTLPANAPATLRAQMLSALAEALSGHDPSERWNTSSPENLLLLTDLNAEPEIELIGSRSYGWRPSLAGDDPTRWFFTIPASFESAKSDGERWRWALAQLSALDSRHRSNESAQIASVMRQVFSARRLPGLSGEAPIVGRHQVPDTPEMALHTLDDDETIVISGGKLRRVKLPKDLAFIPRLKELAMDVQEENTLRSFALECLYYEWSARWQYDRLSTFARQVPKPPGPGDSGMDLTYWLKEMAAPQLRFESHPPQIAGQPAKLRLMFRNVTQAKFTAQAVNMKKIIADIDVRAQQPVKNEKDHDEWKWRTLEGLHARLTGKDATQWLQGKPIRWTAALEPAPHHWDQQIDLPSPLSQAGVYLISCDAGMEKPAQTLLWLDDLVIVTIPQQRAEPPRIKNPFAGRNPFGDRDPFGGGGNPSAERHTRYLVLEAATGRPVLGARLSITGGQASGYQEKDLPFTRVERQTDADGSVVVTDTETPLGHHWLTRVEDKQGRLHVIGPGIAYSGSNDNDDHDVNQVVDRDPVTLFVITDQPAYRPGQQTRWKAWMRFCDFPLKAATNPYANGDLTISLSTPLQHNLTPESRMKFNAEGAVHGVLPLPESGVLGEHAVVIENTYESGSSGFPVEQFRKPEFVAEAVVNKRSAVLGGTFEFQVKARYYSGATLIGGMVRYHVIRQPTRWSGQKPVYPATEWDWLYRNGHAWRYANTDNQEEWPDEHGGEVISGLVPLRADGTAIIPVDTLSAAQLSHTSQRYTLRAWVMDATQRTVELKADHIITPQPCTLLLDADHGFYHAGESGVLTLRSCHTDGSPAAVTAALNHTAPDGTVSTSPFSPTHDGQCQLTLSFKQSGMHRLQVEATLPDGRKATTQRDISVLDATAPSLKGIEAGPMLDMQFRNVEHAPGEDVEILITSRLADSDVWLFIRAEGGVYPDPIHLRLKEHHAIHRVPVTDVDFPNFFVQVATVSEGSVFNVLRQVLVPPKHVIAKVRFETDRQTYLPGDRCRVKIITTRYDGSPLQANVAFTAYDETLDAIRHQFHDERGYSTYHDLPDIRHFFWGWRRTHSQFITSSLHASGLFDYRIPGMIETDWQGYYPWREYNDRADAFADVGSDPSSTPPGGTAVQAMPASLADLLNQTRIRQTLRDNIAWEPDLHTNERGEATVEFMLPDNLTTWSLHAWAVGAKTEVGEATHDLRVTKPLELRIASPRFLIVGDEAVLTASVVDTAQKNQPLRAVVELQGSALNLLDEATQNTTLDASGGAQITWHIKAAAEGACGVRIKAACGTAADATAITLPVRLAHTAQLESWDISVAPEQQERTLEFIVPANDRPDSTRLEVRLTPSVLAVIADALPYLAEYPHGCAEQTLNRFLPTLIAHRAVAALKLDMKALHQAAQEAGAKRTVMKLPEHLQRWQRDEQLPRWSHASLFDAEKVQDMALVGLKRLASMAVRDQHRDGSAGGWAWFGGSERSNAQLTALIVHGFLQARLGGLQGDDNALTAGFTALQKHEEKQLRCVTDPAYYGLKEKHLGNDLDVLVHATLVESLEPPSKSNGTDKLQSLRDNASFRKAQPDASMRRHLIERRDHLASISLARLAMACHQLGENNDRDLLLRLLKDRVKTDSKARIAWIDTTSNGTWQQDFIETQAAFLRLLVLVESDSTLTADIARNLIARRSQGRFWNSTRDTAASIEALATYALAIGEMEKHQTVQVLLDGRMKQQFNLQRDTALAAVPSIIFDAADLQPGKHSLTLRLAGGGSLPATAALQHFGKTTAPQTSPLKLTRRLWRVDPSSIQANQAASQSYWWHQRGIQRELISDATPLKPGDMIELEYQFNAAQPLEYVLLESPLSAALHPLHSLSGWDHQDDVSGDHEIRDDRTCFFMERLNQGTHTLRILTRVENSGTFALPPASITAMYSPAFHATSSSQVMHVK